MTSSPEPTPNEVRLGELVEQYQELRDRDASVGIEAMRDEAGDLFPELAELAECLGLLRAGFGEVEEDIPAEFGPYRIHAQLGAGVSGVVYRAAGRDGREVALKVMRESLVLSPEAMKRFRREIDVAERLEHPNAVKVLDHGEVGGRLYLAMELVDGCSLAELLTELGASGDAPGDEWLAVLAEAQAVLGEYRTRELVASNVWTTAGIYGLGSYVLLHYKVQYSEQPAGHLIYLFTPLPWGESGIVGHQIYAPSLEALAPGVGGS